MSDLWTMMWKEVKDELLQGGRQALIRPLIFIAILGIFLPTRLGLEWLALSPAMIVIIVYIGFVYILNFIGDAVAGERERHTLETLLASRISDRAILLGKVIVTVLYAWAMIIASLLLGPVVVNLTKGAGIWRFYAPLDLLFEALILSLLASLLSASAGVLVSLHSATVRQAQQTLILSTLAFGVVLFLGFKTLPADLFLTLSFSQILLIAIAVLAVLDAILLGISLASFKRSRLILS